MAIIEDFEKNRIKKIEALEKAGFLAFPSSTKRNHKINEAILKFPKLSKEEKEIIIAGRIKSLRVHGGVSFLNIEDDSGIIQGLFREDGLGEKYYQFFINNLDIGDFIEIRGILMK